MFEDPPGIQRPASRKKNQNPRVCTGGPSGVSSDLGPGAGDGEGAWRSSRRGPKFMLIRAKPASSLPCAAPAASSPGHSAGLSGRAAPGGGTRALRGSPIGGGSRAGERRILRGRHRAGPSGDRARWVTVCPCGCAPSRRCSRRRRPRAHRSSHGQHSPVPPATASTLQDGVLGFARGRISKCGARPRRERGCGGVARGAPPLPPARTRAEVSRPGDPNHERGGSPSAIFYAGGRPTFQETAGLVKNKSVEGPWRGGWDPGSARGNLSSEVTFSSCSASKLQAQRTRWRERRQGCPRLEHAGLPHPLPSVSPLPRAVVDRPTLTVGSRSSPPAVWPPGTLWEPQGG